MSSLYLRFCTIAIYKKINKNVYFAQLFCSLIYDRNRERLLSTVPAYVNAALALCMCYSPPWDAQAALARFYPSPRDFHSSIGHTKAALEAVNGCNLYGLMGSSGSTLFIDIDAHFRNRATIDNMLPRESVSKVY